MTATSASIETTSGAPGPSAPPRRVRLAVLAAEALLVMLLALICARLVWTLSAPDAFAPAIETATPAAPAVSVRGAQDWSVLWRFDPFFRGGGPAAPDEVSNAPETTLNLTLAGVRAEPGGEGGVAYVVTPDNVQGAYREGEEIIDGVTLTRVFHNRAIIDRNGDAESLMLDAGRRPFEGGGTAAPAPAAAAGQTEVIEQAQAEDLLAQMQFEPYRGEDGAVGFMIRSDNNSLLADHGLRPGDVVLSIGGVSAASAVEGGDPSALWSAFNAGGATQLEILREGERITRSVRLANGE